MKTSPGQTAVVLSGGGAYGAFGIGVLKTLFAGRSPATKYVPLEPTIFTGTSVGAFNAALLVCRRGTHLEAALEVENIWTERVASVPGVRGNGIFRIRGDASDYVEGTSLATMLSRLTGDSLSIGGYVLSRTANFLASSDPLQNRALGLVNMQDFIDPSPLLDLLRGTINPADVRDSPSTLRMVATDWLTGSAVLFGNEDFVGDQGNLAILASTAIPGVFPPVTVKGGYCVDGGVVQNTPLNTTLDLDATELHVICLNPSPQNMAITGTPSTIDTLMRVYFMQLAGSVAEDILIADWINRSIEKVESLVTAGKFPAQDLPTVLNQVLVSQQGKRLVKVTIHKYLPVDSLGGDLGMLNFDRDRILQLIADGEREALNHNCDAAGCVGVES